MSTLLPQPPIDSCWFSVGRAVHCLVDSETLPLIAQYRWRIVNSYAVTGNGITEPMIYMHRLILDPGEGVQIDHINRNKLDNRKSNLRMCTDAENRLNKGVRGDSQSKYKGVNIRVVPASGTLPERVTYIASIRANGVKKHLGCFRDEIEAAKAYDTAALELHGDFACLNRDIQ